MSHSGFNEVLIVEDEESRVFIVDSNQPSQKSNKLNNEQIEPTKTEDTDEEIIEEHLDESLLEEVPFIECAKPTITSKCPPNTFSCKYCDEKFQTRNDLWMHICRFLECDVTNFICRFCLKHIPKQHFSIHKHEMFTCKICGKSFLTENSLESHHKSMHEESEATFVQENSKEILNPMNQLLRRNGIVNKKKRNYWPRYKMKVKKLKLECDLCGKYLASRKTLKYHLDLHKSHPSFICSTCGEKFFTPNGIRVHKCEKKRKRPEVDFRLTDTRYCRFCDKKFESLDDNKAHKCEFAHPDDAKLVICRICQKVLNRSAFNRHLEIHSDMLWSCEICNKKLATERALKLHFTTHTGNKPYKCSECPETFISKIVLDRHMRFHGRPAKLFRCEFCFKQLSTDLSLKSHIQRLHSTFSQCELCKDKFECKERLKEHMQTSHPPSDCSICGKTFALPRYLQMHMKLHFGNGSSGGGGEERINCQICSRPQLSRNLKSHVYRSHGEQFESWLKEFPNF